jgi:hypothetical protein
MIRVHRRGFVKDVKAGPGVRLKRIAPANYLTPDKGEPGRTPLRKQTIRLDPESHSGFRKEFSVAKNAAIVQRKSGLRSGISQMNALANISADKETAQKARQVQKVLSARLRASKGR